MRSINPNAWRAHLTRTALKRMLTSAPRCDRSQPMRSSAHNVPHLFGPVPCLPGLSGRQMLSLQRGLLSIDWAVPQVPGCRSHSKECRQRDRDLRRGLVALARHKPSNLRGAGFHGHHMQLLSSDRRAGGIFTELARLLLPSCI